MRIRVFETTYKRPKIKDAIDDHVHQIVENWCLIWAANESGKHKETINHWAGELVAQFDPGLDKLDVSGLSKRAQYKLIDEVLYSDAKLDQPPVVARMIGRKFKRGEYSPSLANAAAEAWVEEGLPKVRDIYRGEYDPDDFEQELCGQSPV